jgi:hypothetical protein
MFSKLDIKDGYWRMVVPKEEEWNFAYGLPKADPQEPIMPVIPSSLQMGWTDSLVIFCGESETARDIGKDLINEPIGSLQAHVLEPFMFPSETMEEVAANPQDGIDLDTEHVEKFCWLLETFVDNFINVAQTTDETGLRHHAKAVLEAILSVFPSPLLTDHDGDEPISIKKLLEGDGAWSAQKEILGWIFDGVKRCIQLPKKKVKNLLQELHQASRPNGVPRKTFETLRGQL